MLWEWNVMTVYVDKITVDMMIVMDKDGNIQEDHPKHNKVEKRILAYKLHEVV